MKSNVCILEGANPDIENVLAEVEEAASYNHLSHKAAIQLRLLAEEMIGMQKGILGFAKGSFYIENEKNTYHLCLHADIVVDRFTRKRFEELASNKENAAYRGFLGKIQKMVDSLTSHEEDGTFSCFDSCNIYNSMSFISPTVDYDQMWTLSQYREKVEENSLEWDEMEKSIVANLADEIVIGVRGDYVDMEVVKTFTK